MTATHIEKEFSILTKAKPWRGEASPQRRTNDCGKLSTKNSSKTQFLRMVIGLMVQGTSQLVEGACQTERGSIASNPSNGKSTRKTESLALVRSELTLNYSNQCIQFME